MSWNFYRPYVSVAQRAAKALKHAQKLAKKGLSLAPIKIEGRTIARTFWGQGWCKHLESFSDYVNRLPRGRTYVRNGSVIDLQISPGKITAQVMGSQLYRGTITITPLNPAKWQAIKTECAGKIDSLVGLLQGRLSDAVMRVITDRDNGLFPAPSEIKLECSCPDWADLCKHHAAVLYGVGARLDAQPELLFVLRGVDHLELISAAVQAPGFVAEAAAGEGEGALSGADLSDVFGIEIEPVLALAAKVVEATVPATSVPKRKKLVPAKKVSAAARRPASSKKAKKTGKRR